MAGTVRTPGPAWPSREELAAAIGPETRLTDLIEQFKLSRITILRCMAHYDLPKLVDGRTRRRPTTSDGAPEAFTPVKSRPRARIDDLCDEANEEWIRENAFHNYRISVRVQQPPAEPVGPDVDWREHALCRGLSPTVFLPDVRNEKTTMLAKKVCAVCAARDVCPFSETTRAARTRAHARKAA